MKYFREVIIKIVPWCMSKSVSLTNLGLYPLIGRLHKPEERSASFRPSLQVPGLVVRKKAYIVMDVQGAI